MKVYYYLILILFISCSAEPKVEMAPKVDVFTVAIPDELMVNRNAVNFIYSSSENINNWKDSLAQVAACCKAYDEKGDNELNFMQKYRLRKKHLHFATVMGDFATEMENLITQISNIEAGMTSREVLAFSQVKSVYLDQIQSIYKEYSDMHMTE
jgi:plasmid replication initiation protein